MRQSVVNKNTSGKRKNLSFILQSSKCGRENNSVKIPLKISEQGRHKALQLAEQSGVNIDYQVGELQTLSYHEEQFDVIALIYAHFPGDIKSSIHQMLNQYLRKGGFIIFEAFSKKHLDYVKKNEEVGGPKDIESLFSIEEIQADFPNYSIIELQETEIELKEGLFHNGTGSVIRFVGQKQ